MQKGIKSLLKGKGPKIIAILLTAIIAILSLMRIANQSISFKHIDKLEHAFAYFMLTFFWLASFLKANQLYKLIICLVCILFGILIEVLQGITGYRTFDFADMLANSVGALTGLLIFNLFVKNSNLFSK